MSAKRETLLSKLIARLGAAVWTPAIPVFARRQNQTAPVPVRLITLPHERLWGKKTEHFGLNAPVLVLQGA